MSRLNSLISLNSINKEYSCGNTKVFAVKNANLSIESGKSISITGPSGCGKSTLLNIIGQITKPTSGYITINKKPIKEYSKNTLATLRNEFFGYIAQNYLLVEGYTVFENVEIPLLYSKCKISKSKRKKLILKTLIKVGLEEKINEDIKNLSGGQQQRVAIARALINNPKVILADEPTGALDTKTSNEIMELLLTLVDEGKTLVLVTHNKELANKCDVELKMIDGAII